MPETLLIILAAWTVGWLAGKAKQRHTLIERTIVYTLPTDHWKSRLAGGVN